MDRCAPCPVCGEQIIFTTVRELQGEPPYWSKQIEYLDETIQSCSCNIPDEEMDWLFACAEDCEADIILPDD